MAILYNSILGKISGKAGNIVFRSYKGKTIIAARPSKCFKKPSEFTKNRRQRFKLTCKFVSTALKLKYLKEEWKKTSEKMSAYNAMFKRAYEYISEKEVSDVVPFFPGIGFPINYNIIRNDDNGFRLRIDLKDMLNGNNNGFKYIQMGVVIFLNEQKDCSNDDVLFVEYDSEIMEFKDEIIIGMEYKEENRGLSDMKMQLIKSFNRKKVFVCIKFLGKEKEIIGHSETIGV